MQLFSSRQIGPNQHALFVLYFFLYLSPLFSTFFLIPLEEHIFLAKGKFQMQQVELLLLSFPVHLLFNFPQSPHHLGHIAHWDCMVTLFLPNCYPIIYGYYVFSFQMKRMSSSMPMKEAVTWTLEQTLVTMKTTVS